MDGTALHHEHCHLSERWEHATDSCEADQGRLRLNGKLRDELSATSGGGRVVLGLAFGHQTRRNEQDIYKSDRRKHRAGNGKIEETQWFHAEIRRSAGDQQVGTRTDECHHAA